MWNRTLLPRTDHGLIHLIFRPGSKSVMISDLVMYVVCCVWVQDNSVGGCPKSYSLVDYGLVRASQFLQFIQGCILMSSNFSLSLSEIVRHFEIKSLTSGLKFGSSCHFNGP